jgi:hypothetical protein
MSLMCEHVTPLHEPVQDPLEQYVSVQRYFRPPEQQVHAQAQ